jgi:hypothetical protein
MQVDRDFRIGLKKLRQQRRDIHHAKTHGHRELDQPARHRRLRKRLILGGFAVGQQPRGALSELLPGIGQRETARGAVEQPRAEPLLEPSDRLGDGRLRQRELARRACKGTQLHDLGEDRERLEIRKFCHGGF